MARIARVVVPGIPHHVTQRGNRRLPTFLSEDDYAAYYDYLLEGCLKAGTEVWAYCLMPNHVHLLLLPSHEDGLRAALGEAHRRYTRMINFREGWRGHLWQERFASFPTDAAYLLNAARYIELNPVRAKLVSKPEEYRWSSARAHINGVPDQLLNTTALLKIEPYWQDFLKGRIDEQVLAKIRMHENTGKPLGGNDFVTTIEQMLGRIFQAQKPGPKPIRKTLKTE